MKAARVSESVRYDEGWVRESVRCDEGCMKESVSEV